MNYRPGIVSCPKCLATLKSNSELYRLARHIPRGMGDRSVLCDDCIEKLSKLTTKTS